MNTLQFIALMLVANICLMVHTILKTRKLPFHKDTKTLIYVIAVFTPFFWIYFIHN